MRSNARRKVFTVFKKGVIFRSGVVGEGSCGVALGEGRADSEMEPVLKPGSGYNTILVA
jgi:hypothetical protein